MENNLIKSLDNIFENLLKPGAITESKEIADGFKIKVRPLNIGEIALADTMYSNENGPNDVVFRVRAVRYLAAAIVELNDIVIPEDESLDSKEVRKELYLKLLKLPAVLIEEAYKFYIEVAEKQAAIYTKKGSEELVDAIENF